MITRLRSAGIWISSGRILLESLADREIWGIPGGFVESSESVEQACTREYIEEIGLKMRCIRLAIIHENFWTDSGQSVREYGYYFIVKPAGDLGPCPTIQSQEGHLKFRWYPLSELGSLIFVPPHLKNWLPSLPDDTLFLSTREDLS